MTSSETSAKIERSTSRNSIGISILLGTFRSDSEYDYEYEI